MQSRCLAARIAVLAALVWLATAGCQTGGPSDSKTAESPFQRDMARICNGEQRSGALSQPPEQRQMLVAQWLATNIETADARSLLAQIVQSAPADKVTLLRDAATRAGIDDCPLIRAWGGS
jgi:hypothetical protein